MTPENALIYRRIVEKGDDAVMIEEKWDLTHPDCPFIRNPWSDFQGPLGNRAYRQITLSNDEFISARVPLKPAPES